MESVDSRRTCLGTRYGGRPQLGRGREDRVARAGGFRVVVSGVHGYDRSVKQQVVHWYDPVDPPTPLIPSLVNGGSEFMEGPPPPWLLRSAEALQWEKEKEKETGTRLRKASGGEVKTCEGVAGNSKTTNKGAKKKKGNRRHSGGNSNKGKELVGDDEVAEPESQVVVLLTDEAGKRRLSDSDDDGDEDVAKGKDHETEAHENKAKENDPGDELACPICMGDYEEAELFVFTPCLHAYCLQCVTQYFLTKMEEEEVVEIHCPSPKCDTIAELSDIASVLEHDKFVEFQELRSNVLLKMNPACRYCPRPDCGHPQIGNPAVVHMVCDLCQYEYCFNCRDKWHEGITCKEWQATQAPEDEKTIKWKKKHGVKQCPNCGVEIFKFSGCPRMKCRNCQHTFHWKHGNPMGDQYLNGGFDPEESSFLNMGVTYPLQMRWMLGEYADEVREQKTREGKRSKMLEAVGLGLLATVILLPIFVVAGPPVGTYRGVKKIGRGFKRLTKRSHKQEEQETSASKT